jgi:hypothetical protein
MSLHTNSLVDKSIGEHDFFPVIQSPTENLSSATVFLEYLEESNVFFNLSH